MFDALLMQKCVFLFYIWGFWLSPSGVRGERLSAARRGFVQQRWAGRRREALQPPGSEPGRPAGPVAQTPTALHAQEGLQWWGSACALGCYGYDCVIISCSCVTYHKVLIATPSFPQQVFACQSKVLAFTLSGLLMRFNPLDSACTQAHAPNKPSAPIKEILYVIQHLSALWEMCFYLMSYI